MNHIIVITYSDIKDFLLKDDYDLLNSLDNVSFPFLLASVNNLHLEIFGMKSKYCLKLHLLLLLDIGVEATEVRV